MQMLLMILALIEIRVGREGTWFQMIVPDYAELDRRSFHIDMIVNDIDSKDHLKVLANEPKTFCVTSESDDSGRMTWCRHFESNRSDQGKAKTRIEADACCITDGDRGQAPRTFNIDTPVQRSIRWTMER